MFYLVTLGQYLDKLLNFGIYIWDLLDLSSCTFSGQCHDPFRSVLNRFSRKRVGGFTCKAVTGVTRFMPSSPPEIFEMEMLKVGCHFEAISRFILVPCVTQFLIIIFIFFVGGRNSVGGGCFFRAGGIFHPEADSPPPKKNELVENTAGKLRSDKGYFKWSDVIQEHSHQEVNHQNTWYRPLNVS